MNVGAIFIGVAIVLLVGVYVARPLFEKKPVRRGAEPLRNTRTELVAQRDAVYALIHELDADYQTGKVNDADYQAQRERYVAQGVAILKQLDELPDEESVEEREPTGRTALDAEIEAAVQALRQKPVHQSTHLPAPSPPRFCTQCGRRAYPEDKFCGSCGAPLKEAAPQ